MSDWTPIDPFAPDALVQLQTISDRNVSDALFEITDWLAREARITPEQFERILDVIEPCVKARWPESARRKVAINPDSNELTLGMMLPYHTR